MSLIVTFGIPTLFFVAVVVILQRASIRDRDFTDFAVAGRSFGSLYQAMAFLNTWFPGTIFIASFGLIASKGAFGLFILPYSLLAVLTMFLMADRVWPWAARHNLRTQPDLLALRFNSAAIRPIAALIGVASLFPWMVLGMQSLGAVFSQLSLGHLSYTSAVVLGIAIMALRQIWTVRMGMRGVVISDLFQGLVAYGLGSAIILGLIAWLLHSGASLSAIDPSLLKLPDLSTPAPLAFFSLVLSGTLGGLCWPDLFVRLYTGSGVRAVKTSSAIGAPVALLFGGALGLLALLASSRPDVAGAPELGWFTLANQAGGPLLLALAGTCVFAASMGNIDATVQSCGAQIAGDIIAALRPKDRPPSERTLIVVAQIAMIAVTLAAAFVACLPLPQLFSLAILAYQGIIQLSVPLYLGIFTRLGNRYGAIGGMLAGIGTVAVLELSWPAAIPWAYGLTSGVLGLAVNLAVFIGAHVLFRRSANEEARVERLFAEVAPAVRPVVGQPLGEPVGTRAD